MGGALGGASTAMAEIDMRRPAEVTADFRALLGELLVPKGFVARAKGARFVRNSGRNKHEISLGSSHYNAPGNVTCFVAYFFFDAATRASDASWRAGGTFDGPAFFDRTPNNVAHPDHAAGLVRLMVERLAFFDWLERPADALRLVCERYVPGFYEPHVIVPYLRAHLGADAVQAYALALLAARPELWPAFLGRLRDPKGSVMSSPDHGTSLATAMAGEGALAARAAPDDVALSGGGSAGNLRAFFGLMLRAWGEPELAARLRRSTDEDVERLWNEHQALPDHRVDSVEAARLVVRSLTGEARSPARSQPSPLHFQYHVAHGAFSATG